jgi:hypothetical protein
VLKVRLEPEELKVHKVEVVQQVLKVILVDREHKVLKDQQVVHLEPQDQWVQQEPKVLKVEQEEEELPVLKVLRVQEVHKEDKVLKVL